MKLVTILFCSLFFVLLTGCSTVGLPFATLTPTASEYGNTALEYIAATYNVPPEDLQIGSQNEKEYPNLGQTYHITALNNFKTSALYYVLINTQDGSITEDWQSIEDAEHSAPRVVSKIDAELADYIQNLSDSTTVDVIIWLAVSEDYTTENLHAGATAVLVEKYPEARAAVEVGGFPTDIADPELAEQVRHELRLLVAGEINDYVESTVVELGLQDNNYQPFSGAPAIAITLPKGEIVALSEAPQVGKIYLSVEGKGSSDIIVQ